MSLARFFISFSFTIYLLLLIPANAHAAFEFQTDYSVTYKVSPDAKTGVTQEITLKNKTANYYADKFELKIGSIKVENVKAQDSTGPMETNVKFENNLTAISVKFNQRVIGIDKTQSWTLNYTSAELTAKSGQIWEISIPRLAKSEEIGIYKAKVIVPASFGPIAFSTPSPRNTAKVASDTEFTFDKDQLFESGIAMSFGEKQVFEFNLNYYLENPNVTGQIDYIALPPDNNYQRVVLQKIDPPPVDVTPDEDNNFLAKYRLPPKSKLNINLQGRAEVFSKPFRNIYTALTKEERQKYTQPQRYWETDNASIKEKAGELKTPKAIYDFVAATLIYSQERLNQPDIERLGAASALLSPQEAVCMEFTDLFIAIARANGIPAREVEGYAYTQNERLRPLSLTLPQGDILHAWPEYWDENLGWVQIDPTWGSTSGGIDYFEKLDFNHITFVQRGISSTDPAPAGGYKRKENLGEKTVFVSFAKDLPLGTITPELSLSTPDKIISGIPAKAVVTLKNIGSISIIGEKLTLEASNFKNISPASQLIAILPPFAKKNFIVKLQTDNLFLNTQDTLVLNYAQAQLAKPVIILPIYRIVFSQNFALVILTAFAIIGTGLILYYRLHRMKHNNGYKG